MVHAVILLLGEEATQAHGGHDMHAALVQVFDAV